MNDRQDNTTRDGSSSARTGAAQGGQLPRRRRLLAGGVAAAPILLTVGSRSALANGLCPSPSRVFSGMASPNPSDHFTCNGRSPGYWKICQNFGEWPVDAPTVEKNGGGTWSGCTNASPSQPDKARFVDADYGASFYSIFAMGCARELKAVVAPTARTISMWEILAFPTDVAAASGVGAETVQLARHCIAAYFTTR